MFVINGFKLPENTRAVKLEPSPSLDKAIIEYDKENDVLVYDVEVLIECFVENGMSHEEAWDWFNYNTLNTNVQGYPKFTYEKNKKNT
tara:strand:- start:158 stop:421 length:264 start_codon:yes stop_codon:yes gene_type:complete